MPRVFVDVVGGDIIVGARSGATELAGWEDVAIDLAEGALDEIGSWFEGDSEKFDKARAAYRAKVTSWLDEAEAAIEKLAGTKDNTVAYAETKKAQTRLKAARKFMESQPFIKRMGDARIPTAGAMNSADGKRPSALELWERMKLLEAQRKKASRQALYKFAAIEKQKQLEAEQALKDGVASGSVQSATEKAPPAAKDGGMPPWAWLAIAAGGAWLLTRKG